MKLGNTYPVGIRSWTRYIRVRVIELVDILEYDDPAHPATSSIKQRLHGILDTVIQLQSALDVLGHMSPASRYSEIDNDWDHIDDHGEIPRYQNVGCCPI